MSLIKMPGWILGLLLPILGWTLPAHALPLLQTVATDPEISYSVIDATIIFLREGLEGFLVVVALLALLTKQGYPDKQIWVWVGALAGILGSIATALLIRALFASTFRDIDPELLEGATGLLAAILLIWVSYWLHGQTTAKDWQTYLKTQTTEALATNRLLSLALIAFLAIYREGAETVLFYLGIAPAITPSDLLTGLGLGAVLLAILAFLILKIGIRIPLKLFFLVTSTLIYALGFKFIGNATHAFQEAGILPLHPLATLPAIKWLGVYPTWETMIPQAILVLVAVVIILIPYYWTPQSDS